MDIPQIKKLIQLLNDNNLGEITVKEGETKITIRHRDYAKISGVGSISAVPTVAATTSNTTETKKEDLSRANADPRPDRTASRKTIAQTHGLWSSAS